MVRVTGLRRKVAWLIAIRAIISTILLGSAIVTQITRAGSFAVDPFFFLIGLTYALTITFALTVRYVDELPLAGRRPAGGRCADRVGVHLLSPAASPATSRQLYVLPIVAASIGRSSGAADAGGDAWHRALRRPRRRAVLAGDLVC